MGRLGVLAGIGFTVALVPGIARAEVAWATWAATGASSAIGTLPDGRSVALRGVFSGARSVSRVGRIAVLLALALVLGVPRADAQLSSATMYVDIDAGVWAVDMDTPFVSDFFADGPREADIFLDGDTISWDVQAASGGGAATSDGTLDYLATTSQIFTRGDFSMLSSAESPAAASAGFDAVWSVDFQVAVETTFTLSGYVSTMRDLDGPEVVACQYNGVVLAGDSRATPLAAGTYPFSVERTLFPEEHGVLQCAAATSGGQSDANALAWEVAVNGLPEAETSLASCAAIAALATIARRSRTRR